MIQDSVGFTLNEIEEGQARLAWVMKRRVDQLDPALFERLDLNDDRPFLDPALFAFLAAPRPGRRLEQILFGFIPKNARPERIPVYSDGLGQVHLPGIGRLQTVRPHQPLELHWNTSTSTLELSYQGESIEHTAQPRHLVLDMDIELYLAEDPLFAPCYRNLRGEVVPVEIFAIAQRHADHLDKATEVVRDFCPSYFMEIAAVARAVSIFEHPELRPFATMAAHGMSFLNASRALDEIFFIAEIVHQFGHNILNAVLLDVGSFLKVDPWMALRDLTGDPTDGRSVLSAFHGLYTTTKTAECLDTILNAGIFEGRKAHDLLGRLADNRDRVSTRMEAIDRNQILTERGERMFCRMKEICSDIYARRAAEIRMIDTSNQPFVFDYELFAATNPMGGAAL